MSFDDEFDELALLAYQTAFRILGSRAEAEEIAQETMAKAYVRWRRVRGHARPWVCRVAANAALGVVRRRGRRVSVDTSSTTHPTDAVDRVDVQRLLESLSGRQRDVVVLRYLADLSEVEVGAELGISVGTVKTHAHRAIQILRRHVLSDAALGTDAPHDRGESRESTDA